MSGCRSEAIVAVHGKSARMTVHPVRRKVRRVERLVTDCSPVLCLSLLAAIDVSEAVAGVRLDVARRIRRDHRIVARGERSDDPHRRSPLKTLDRLLFWCTECLNLR